MDISERFLAIGTRNDFSRSGVMFSRKVQMPRTPRSCIERALAATLLVAAAASQCSAQLCGSMESLGRLPGGSGSNATGVSADGSIVVGTASNPTAGQRAWRWERATGLRDLGTLGGMTASATAVSADGSTVVGRSINAWGYDYASMWIACDTSLSLGTITGGQVGGFSEALGVSADGTVVVGMTTLDASLNYGPFRWDAISGMQSVGLGLHSGEAHAVSADGRVVVGRSDSRAFRWTFEEGAIDLGMLPGYDSAIARAVSADGSVIVGSVSKQSAPDAEQAFRWTAESGMQSLGSLAGSAHSAARGVSSDGSVIVGRAHNVSASSGRAFRWTATSGMQDLGSLGTPAVAYAVSADGTVVVGSSSSVAFRWQAIENAADYDGDYFLQVTDFLDFLDDFSSCQGHPSPCGQFGNPDINADGMIDVLDLLDYLDAYARGC